MQCPPPLPPPPGSSKQLSAKQNLFCKNSLPHDIGPAAGLIRLECSLHMSLSDSDSIPVEHSFQMHLSYYPPCTQSPPTCCRLLSIRQFIFSFFPYKSFKLTFSNFFFPLLHSVKFLWHILRVFECDCGCWECWSGGRGAGRAAVG